MRTFVEGICWLVMALTFSRMAHAAESLPADPSPAQLTVEQRLEQLEKLKAEAPVAPPASAPIANLSEGETKSASKAQLTVGGYAEAFYQWNFNNPSNFITNYRGYDNRHNMFTIQNAVLDAVGALGPVTTHLALQVGQTPETSYMTEPVWRATAAAGASGPQVWKFLQQANITYVVPVGRGLTLDTGIFLSPIGPEGMAVKDQWNWSRSNLFFGLPFYHSGARATYPMGEHGTVSLQIYNGWNSVVDNNPELSFAGQYTYSIPDKITLNALYFGGVERNIGAAEGRAWRHLFDTYVAIFPKPWLSAILHVDVGAEPNHFGTSGWAASALYLRAKLADGLFLAARGDVFREWIASDANGTAAPIFWNGAAWVSSQTLTADFRPVDNLSIRLEYRHDQAAANLYFRGSVALDKDGNFLTNSPTQDTLTLGVTSWF